MATQPHRQPPVSADPMPAAPTPVVVQEAPNSPPLKRPETTTSHTPVAPLPAPHPHPPQTHHPAQPASSDSQPNGALLAAASPSPSTQISAPDTVVTRDPLCAHVNTDNASSLTSFPAETVTHNIHVKPQIPPTSESPANPLNTHPAIAPNAYPAADTAKEIHTPALSNASPSSNHHVAAVPNKPDTPSQLQQANLQSVISKGESTTIAPAETNRKETGQQIASSSDRNKCLNATLPAQIPSAADKMDAEHATPLPKDVNPSETEHDTTRKRTKPPIENGLDLSEAQARENSNSEAQPDTKRQKLDVQQLVAGTEQARKKQPEPLADANTSPNPPSSMDELNQAKPITAATRVEAQDHALEASMAPSSGVALPLLRSSPVFVDRAPPSNSTQSAMTGESGGKDLDPNAVAPNVGVRESQESGTQEEAAADHPMQPPESGRKRKKSVSWAPEENLVDVQYIDTRIELVRSWDSDSQITLPFAPGTLQMFQQALKEQDAARRGAGQGAGKGGDAISLRSMPKLTSFEEARKKEHDMEQERAKQAREQLKERLNTMSPSRPWKTPVAIVLPAECWIDANTVEPFSAVGDDTLEYPGGDTDARSPASPPRLPTASYDRSRARRREVPILPLSDKTAESRSTEGMDVSQSGSVDRNYGRSSVHHQEHYLDNMDRRRGQPLATGFRGRQETAPEGHRRDTREIGNPEHNSTGRYGRSNFANNPPPQPQEVQHLLSALQSSGLLKPGSDIMNTRTKSPAYGRRPSNRDDTDRQYRPSYESNASDIHQQDGRDGYGNGKGSSDHSQDDISVPPGQNVSGAIGPPPMLGHPPQMGAPFPPGVQQPGMMDVMPFPMAIPPPMGMPPPNMLPLGLGIPMPMGVPLPMPIPMPPGPMPMNEPGLGGNTSNMSGGSGVRAHGGGRGVETISRPKPKPAKQRKRCKYFGTKQGCRDGSACMFAHN